MSNLTRRLALLWSERFCGVAAKVSAQGWCGLLAARAVGKVKVFLRPFCTFFVFLVPFHTPCRCHQGCSCFLVAQHGCCGLSASLTSLAALDCTLSVFLVSTRELQGRNKRIDLSLLCQGSPPPTPQPRPPHRALVKQGLDSFQAQRRVPVPRFNPSKCPVNRGPGWFPSGLGSPSAHLPRQDGYSHDSLANNRAWSRDRTGKLTPVYWYLRVLACFGSGPIPPSVFKSHKRPNHDVEAFWGGQQRHAASYQRRQRHA